MMNKNENSKESCFLNLQIKDFRSVLIFSCGFLFIIINFKSSIYDPILCIVIYLRSSIY